MPPNRVQGGPARPIKVSLTGPHVGGPAIPVYLVQPADGYKVAGGPAMNTYLVTDPNYPVVGGPALPISYVADSAAPNAEGGPAIPISCLNLAALQAAMGGGVTIPWFLSGGVAAANGIVAHRAKGAASYLASKVNLANPGIYDAVDGVAFPTWNAGIGWTFTAASLEYLESACPANMKPASYLIRCKTNGVLVFRVLVGGNNDRSLAVDLSSLTNIPRLLQQDTALIGSGTAGFGDAVDTVIGVSYSAIGDFAFYTNGVPNGTGNNNLSFNPLRTLIIGAQLLGGAVEAPMDGDISALALYDTVLTPAQFLAISNSMALL